MMKKVAIVDDNKVNLNLYRQYLKDKYEVEIYSGGNEFLASLHEPELTPDVVILDVMMPDISGYEVCRRIKTSDRYRHIKVFICTALKSEFDIEKAADVMADDYIVKPVKSKDLSDPLASL